MVATEIKKRSPAKETVYAKLVSAPEDASNVSVERIEHDARRWIERDKNRSRHDDARKKCPPDPRLFAKKPRTADDRENDRKPLEAPYFGYRGKTEGYSEGDKWYRECDTK